MRILITGNLGYIGTELTKYFKLKLNKSYIIGVDNNYFSNKVISCKENPNIYVDHQYNIDIRDIIRMNSINQNSILRLGQQLTIGNKNIHRNIESKKRTILYSVKQGDNLYKISDIFDVSVESIKQINEFESSDLMPGQIIKIAIRAF